MSETGDLSPHASCADGHGCCDNLERCGPVFRHESVELEVEDLQTHDADGADGQSLETENAVIIEPLGGTPFFYLPGGLSHSHFIPRPAKREADNANQPIGLPESS